MYPHGKEQIIPRLGGIEALLRTDTEPRLTFRLPAPLSSTPGSVSVFGLTPPPPPRPCELVCCTPPPLGEPTLGRGLANPIVDLRHYRPAGEHVTSTCFKRLSLLFCRPHLSKQQKIFSASCAMVAFNYCCRSECLGHSVEGKSSRVLHVLYVTAVVQQNR